MNRLKDFFSQQKQNISLPKLFFHGKGCSLCGQSGYKGRIGIFELLIVDDTLRSVITAKDVTFDSITAAAKEAHMVTMLEDGLGKADLGITTIEEVFRAISE
jgi:type II secretory ATPase GspE/PulE/Tfp pilus assembly ATPase PilB-like protein